MRNAAAACATGWQRYALAVLLVGAITAICHTLPALAAQTPLLPSLVAVFFIAHYAGWAPALLATALSPVVSATLLRQIADAQHSLGWGARLAPLLTAGLIISLTPQSSP